MIGVFDSGVGGLSVVKELIKVLPDCRIIYFGDTARLPYGTKGKEFIKKYSAKITEWLLNKGVEIIVIACHTSSAQAGDFLKEKFKGIPIFDMITSCAKEVSFYKNVGMIGTPGTIKSHAWEKHLLALNPDLKIRSMACPLFVPLVEENWMNKKATQEIAEEYLKEFKNKDIDALILACTHYPFLEKVIKNTLGENIKIINPAESLARELKAFLENKKLSFAKALADKSAGKHQFFFSDEPYNFEKMAKLCLNQKIKPKITNEII